MSNLKCKFLCIVILSFVLLPQIGFAYVPSFEEFKCGEMRDFVDKYVGPGLRIVPGGLLPYRDQELGSRLSSSYLSIESEQHLDQLAEAFASGIPGTTASEFKTKLAAYWNKGDKNVSLNNILPKNLVLKTDSFPSTACGETNCFNATISWFFRNSPTKFTPSDDMNGFLDSHTVKLPAGSALKFGDILVIRESFLEYPTLGFVLSHTAIVLDDNLIWHKASRFSSEPWTFEALDNTLSFYGNRTTNVI